MIIFLSFNFIIFPKSNIFILFSRKKNKNIRFNKVQFIISVTLMEDRMTSSRHALMNWATHVLQ